MDFSLILCGEKNFYRTAINLNIPNSVNGQDTCFILLCTMRTKSATSMEKPKAAPFVRKERLLFVADVPTTERAAGNVEGQD